MEATYEKVENLVIALPTQLRVIVADAQRINVIVPVAHAIRPVPLPEVSILSPCVVSRALTFHLQA